MGSNNTSKTSRRRLLKLGTIGLATSIAGCEEAYTTNSDNNDNDDNTEPTTPPQNEDTAPDNVQTEPSGPVARVTTPANLTFDISEFIGPDGNPNPSNPEPRLIGGKVDTRIATLNIQDAQTITATLANINVMRDLSITLNIRNDNGQFQTVTQTLPATDTDTHENREITFDLTNIALPTGTGTICDLTCKDPQAINPSEHLLTRHQFLGIPYKNGVNWLNKDTLNWSFYNDRENRITHEPPTGNSRFTANEHMSGWTEHIDDDTERAFFMATRRQNTGELFGVSTHIQHEPAQDFIEGTERYQYRYGVEYELDYATEISHFQELAEKTHQVISNLGITTPHERLEYLGDLIQSLPYLRQHPDPSPTVVMYNNAGDCSAKAWLMSAILQNDPWNIMHGYVICSIGGINHATIGLDVDDLGDLPNQEELSTVSPTSEQIENGIPDTEYAFLDLTYDAEIGEISDKVEDIRFYDIGDLSLRMRRHAEDPPDY